jgi:LuxR family maltose regulon positive regulatory protein
MQHGQERVTANRVESPIDQLTLSRLAVPVPPPVAVERARLFDLVDNGVRGPLTLVSAPAGTGKTVAVSGWVASGRAPGPVVWISLGEDTDAARLRALLAEAVYRAHLFDRDSLPEPGGAFPDAFLTAFAAGLAGSPDPVILILDCPVDLPQDAASEVHELVAASAGQLRLVTLTRADPLLPLHLYRLNESLVEIRIADLAFTADEAQQLLGRRGVTTPRDVVDIVVARTRGWAAGLVMASMTLAHSDDVRQAVRQIDGATGPVAEYLVAEVLSALTPSTRSLLLSTSVVAWLRPGLIEALAGPQAGRALAMLTRGNAFLEELPGTPGWYRYHPLFRELLSAQLAEEAPEEATRLHLIAASWLAGQGLILDAVRAALATGAWDEAASIVVEELAVAQLLPRYGDGRLRALVRALPPTAMSTAALLVRAALAFSERRYRVCADLLEHARRRGGGAVQPSRAEAVTLAALSAVCAGGSRAPVEAVMAAVGQARALLEVHDHSAGHAELVLLVEDAAADVLFREGRFAEAAEACRTAVSVADGEFAVEQTNCIGRLAFIAAWSGHCRRAVRLAERANGLQKSAHLSPATCSPLPEVALAWAYTETGEMARAEQHAATADHVAKDATAASGAGVARVADAIVRSRIRRSQGDLSGARAALQEGGRPVDGAPAWVTDQVVVEEALAHLLEGRPRRALELPDSLSGTVRDAARLVRTEAELLCVDAPAPVAVRDNWAGDDLALRVQKTLLSALYHARRGNERSCFEAIERALRLAAPEHLRRPFQDAPEPVRRALSNRRDLTARHPWLLGNEPDPRTRTRVTAPDPVDGGAPLVEPLTDKEREVLGLLAQLLTTEETAAAMFVSVNTIRTHVRNILRKMGVTARNQAIRRGRDLGILPAM